MNNLSPSKKITMNLSHCRCEYSKNDMWSLLERNWDNFYWLTGEIPPTLNYLVEEIEDKVNLLHTGRNPVISFRNQVKWHFKRKYHCHVNDV